MQFLPATFAAYAHPPPPGGADPPSPYDPVSAIHAAARYLCASGATQPGGLRAAIHAYNHSNAYVADVLGHAARYTAPAPAGSQAATVPDPTGTGRLVTPRTAAVYTAARTAGLIGSATCVGQRPDLPDSDHPRGRACDFFFDPHDPNQVAAGWRLATWLTSHAHTFGINYIIWQGRIWSSNRPRWTTYTSTAYHCPDQANTTGCHYDHLHLSLH